MRKRYLIVPLLALVLGACGQPESPTAGGAPLQASAPAATIPATIPASSPTDSSNPTASPALTDTPVPVPTSAPALTPSDAPNEAVVSGVQQLLAGHLGIKSSALSYTSFSSQSWPDGSLGCPKQGVAYPQMVTNGYLIVYSDGARKYEVHTGEHKEDAVLCLNNQPVALSGTSDSAPTPRRPGDGKAGTGITPTPEGATGEGQQAGLNDSNRPLVTLARKNLAKKLSVKEDAIGVASIEEVEWRDSSLGCPQPDMMYMQVITPGYRITLDSQGKRYVYHTNLGDQVILCSK